MERIIQGDCLDVLKDLPDNSIDAVVTDPPYGLSKEPDIREVLTKWMNGEDYHHRGGGFMGKTWDSFVPGPSIWREVFRVLKPGGHALVFAGTRTQDLMAISLRLAGFEIRDVIEWLYFSGFPKSQDVGKAFDRRRTEDLPAIRRVCRFIRAAMDEKGLKSRDLVQYFDNCHPRLIDHWAARDTDSQPAVPKWEQYLILKKVLGLSDEMDAEVWRLNGRKGKPGDAWFEREKIGERVKLESFQYKGNNVYQINGDKDKVTLDITAPATDLAKKWDGWGSQLKPAHEPIIYAHKPFNSVPFSGIMKEITSLLEVALCLLLSSVNGAEKILRSSPPVQNAGSDFAVMSAALLHGERSGELKELMATFNSPETVLTCLNIATLWSSILEESSKNGSMFTTKMETSLTTVLKTLKSLLFPITQEPTIRDAMLAHGFGLSVSSAERNLNGEGKNTSDTLKRFAAVSAILRTRENGTPANIAANALRLITPSVVSVLSHALTEIRQNSDTQTGMQHLDATIAEQNLLNSNPEPETKTSAQDPAISKGNEQGSQSSHLPILLCRKPLEGSICDNVERWGTGAINVDACRIGYIDEKDKNSCYGKGNANPSKTYTYGFKDYDRLYTRSNGNEKGRFPANCVTTEPDMFYSKYFNITPPELCKKASKKDRLSTWDGRKIEKNNHPTVKNTELLAWCIRLITPPGGIVLDPFAGSGSTLVAAKREGFGFIGIEREPEYVEIAKARVGA